MKKLYAGIDAGSTQCKAALFDGEKLVGALNAPMSWDVKRTAAECLEALLSRYGAGGGEVTVAATGYGREAVDKAALRPTEITCHARGALFLRPDIQGVVDIGGQDSKVILLQNGRVADFIMNDKCAAGTGRFLSMAAGALGIPLSGIDGMTDTENAVSITSMCTVFAESELIGHLSRGTDRRRLMAGVLESIAKKIRQQAGKLEFTTNRPVLLTGGLSACATLRGLLARALELPVVSDPRALYAGAIGACLSAAR